MRLPIDQEIARGFVEPPRRDEHAVGPKRDGVIASAARELRTRIGQHPPDPQPPRLRLDQQQPQFGNAMPLRSIPTGTVIHNIELHLGRGGQIARSAGSSVQLVAKEGEYASVKMPSSEIRKIYIDCYATVGQVGNLDHENVSIGKAGRSRWLGKRPHVRGVAMNPVDHPLGGGEGKTSGGRHPVSPWGLPTKGYKTRNRKATDQFIVQRRQK